MTTFTLKSQNVNSPSIFNEVSDFVAAIITDFNIIWNSEAQRETILEVIDERLEDMFLDEKIEQWNVICDGRNNKRADIKDDVTNLYIEFKQRNCFNVTKLYYVVSQ